MEISLNKGCVYHTNNEFIRKQVSENVDSLYFCQKSLWKSFAMKYGSVLDDRDQKVYKTVEVGSQIWMAENLNYSDSINYPSMLGHNWCYNNSLDSCSKYGRLYTWSAAMDSVGTFSTNGKDCGYRKNCSPTYPVRGICPEGWHLPDTTELRNLYELSPYAMLKGVGGETPGFAMYNPNGYIFQWSETFFWCSTETLGYSDEDLLRGVFADSWSWYYEEFRISRDLNNNTSKEDGHSVRCLKDSN
jgi:uncharacterized protein (TIGR02145 family)